MSVYIRCLYYKRSGGKKGYYPNDLDRSLNEAAADKIRKYRADYKNKQREKREDQGAKNSTTKNE